MLGTGLQFGRGYGEDRFYNSVKARRNHYHHNHQNQQQQQEQLQRSRNNGAVTPSMKGKGVISDNREPENRAGSEEHSIPMAMPASKPITPPLSNLDQFIESTTPSVPAQYLSKTRMKGWQTCNVEFQPYFILGDLWESFKEWSAYGAGVPIVLNGSDGVIQYYVPYLSGIQIYGESTSSPDKSSFVSSYSSLTSMLRVRRPGEESDSDFCKDSSSDGSSDCELERGLRCSREQWNCHHLRSEAALGLNTLSLGDKHIALQEDFSSDEGEPGNSRGSLLFEFFEQNPPYSREPLADKISDLACRFPKLKTLRSCDLLSTSWISVAWYPIYRIPTGPTLRDLDACFLTFHSLSTPMRVGAEGPPVTFPDGVDGIPRISLPVFGLASYKCKGSMWITNGGCERQLTTSLLQAADKWLRQLHVNHPDFRFFVSNGTYRR